MNLIKPKNLKKGDTIAIVAPAGVVEKEDIFKAKEYFEKQGYNIKFSEHLFDTNRYMSSEDKKRAQDLMTAFSDKEVDAIVCARGGYGAIRLLEYLDFEIIRQNPKIFCGYSDITALSLIILKKAGLITFSAPMAQSDFATLSPKKNTEKSFLSVLSGVNEVYKSESIINAGTAEGIIWGGNLSTVVSLCGIDFIPDEKFIFFTEDVNEPVYKIDKMLTQLLNIEKFRNNLSAIAFGEFIGTDNNEWLNALLLETSNKLNLPTARGFKFSHSKEKQTIPIGAKAFFNGNIQVI